jgi:predicted nucleotidyltransferase
MADVDFARGDATAGSDVDLLAVARGFPRRLSERGAELLALYAPVREAGTRRAPARVLAIRHSIF